jgi:hypothetical protein
MPIDKAEFESGKPHNQVEDDVMKFLNERRTHAFTSAEILAGVEFHTDFSTLETSRISTFTVADFIALLSEMVQKGKIKAKRVESQMFFATAFEGAGQTAKCPKCFTVAEAKKTWNMTGRPDKLGRRLTMHIGLFECPRHGNFRIALSKHKI